jgi:hypothetical protein
MRCEIHFGAPVPDELLSTPELHVRALEHILREISPVIEANPEQCMPLLIRAIDPEAGTNALTES